MMFALNVAVLYDYTVPMPRPWGVVGLFKDKVTAASVSSFAFSRLVPHYVRLLLKDYAVVSLHTTNSVYIYNRL